MSIGSYGGNKVQPGTRFDIKGHKSLKFSNKWSLIEVLDELFSHKLFTL
jgi:hypothetical protein